MESSTCAYIRTFTSGSSISNQRTPHARNGSRHPVRRSPLVRSRSTPGRGCTSRTVTNWKGGGSDGPRRFRASSNVLEMKALTLMPRASAARRTCFRKLVVKGDCRSHDAFIITYLHRCINTVKRTIHSHPTVSLALVAEPVSLPIGSQLRLGQGASAAGASTAPWRRPARPATWRRSPPPLRTAPAICASSPPTVGGTGRGRRRGIGVRVVVGIGVGVSVEVEVGVGISVAVGVGVGADVGMETGSGVGKDVGVGV